MNIGKALEHIDAEAIAQDTLDLLRVPSETGQEGEAGRFFADLLRREGFDPMLDEVAPDRHDVYAGIAAPSCGRLVSARTLMLNGHLDTIPIGASGPAGRDGDWLVGHGAEDRRVVWCPWCMPGQRFGRRVRPWRAMCG